MGSRGSNVFRALNTSSFWESCGRSTPFEPRSKCLKWKQQRPGFCLSYLRIHTGITALNNTVIINEELGIGCGIFEGTITPTGRTVNLSQDT
jgi:hypothetical protein